MKSRRFDHIDLRVNDRAEAKKFYDVLMPALGFVRKSSNEEWLSYYASRSGVSDFFGFTEDKSHRANGNRLSFWAETRGDVDQIVGVLNELGARQIERDDGDYGPEYYAVFFEDPFGNKMELCCRTDS